MYRIPKSYIIIEEKLRILHPNKITEPFLYEQSHVVMLIISLLQNHIDVTMFQWLNIKMIVPELFCLFCYLDVVHFLFSQKVMSPTNSVG